MNEVVTEEGEFSVDEKAMARKQAWARKKLWQHRVHHIWKELCVHIVLVSAWSLSTAIGAWFWDGEDAVLCAVFGPIIVGAIAGGFIAFWDGLLRKPLQNIWDNWNPK